jgi:hypothetical protein
MFSYLDLRFATDVLEEHAASNFRDKDMLSKQQAPHLVFIQTGKWLM